MKTFAKVLCAAILLFHFAPVPAQAQCPFYVNVAFRNIVTTDTSINFDVYGLQGKDYKEVGDWVALDLRFDVNSANLKQCAYNGCRGYCPSNVISAGSKGYLFSAAIADQLAGVPAGSKGYKLTLLRNVKQLDLPDTAIKLCTVTLPLTAPVTSPLIQLRLTTTISGSSWTGTNMSGKNSDVTQKYPIAQIF